MAKATAVKNPMSWSILCGIANELDTKNVILSDHSHLTRKIFTRVTGTPLGWLKIGIDVVIVSQMYTDPMSIVGSASLSDPDLIVLLNRYINVLYMKYQEGKQYY